MALRSYSGYSRMEVVNDLRRLSANVCRDTAQILLALMEVEDRQVHLEDGYGSLSSWCIAELHYSEDATYRRITAARAARRVPAILGAVEDGRLHLTAVSLLSAHVTRDNAEALIAAATHRSRREIEHFLAERFPRPDVATVLRPIGLPATAPQSATISRGNQLALGRVGPDQSRELQSPAEPLPSPTAAGTTLSSDTGVPADPQRVAPSALHGTVFSGPTQIRTHARVKPLSPGRYSLQLTISAETRELLERAKELLGHAVPSGDLDEVLARALRALIEKHEKRRFGVGAKPRAAATPDARVPSPDPRAISAELRRTIHARDGGRCTFVSTTGRRCDSRTRLEIHHVTNVARGGAGTLANLALRCRAHNQHQADRDFGAGFMREQRESAAVRRGGAHS